MNDSALSEDARHILRQAYKLRRFHHLLNIQRMLLKALQAENDHLDRLCKTLLEKVNADNKKTQS